MGKISGKSLAEKYLDFQEPCVTVLAGGREIPAGKGIYLDYTEVISSVGPQPDMAVLCYRAGRYTEQDFTLLEGCLAVGQRMEVLTGYAGQESRIFLGYLHQVEAADGMRDYVEYILTCLDVKGLMKKNNALRISGAQKAQQQLEDILGQSCYRSLVEKKKIETLPKELNQDCVINGETHYDWLCGLAARADYEFFCGRGEMVFRKARRQGPDCLELAVEYGLLEVRGTVTMAEQTGYVQVCGHNRMDEKAVGRAEWPGAPGPFAGGIRQALRGIGLCLRDPEAETGEQAKQRAKTMMERRSGRCSRVRAVNLGIPELRPGILADITSGNAESLSGRIYVEEVRHLLDETGYRSIAEGVRLKA